MPDVFLHIGLPKTGTTTVQAELDRRVDALAEHGVLFPGGGHRGQRLAAYDLLGQRIQGEDASQVAGALNRLTAEINAYEGRSVVVSEEALALARPRHVRRLVRGLEGQQVFVIVSVRDPARALVSAWHQSVVMGGTRTMSAYLEQITGPDPGADGIAFLLRQDLPRVLDTWSTQVPADRIRLVTVPPSGSAPDLVLERFGAAAELPPEVWSGFAPARNVSLGAAEIEVVRRLNATIVEPLEATLYRHVIERGIRERLVPEGSRPLRLPEEHLEWARARGAELVGELEQRGHPVHGDLSDLVPAPPVAGTPRTDVVSQDELLAAAEAELASLALAFGAQTKRHRALLRSRNGSRARAGAGEVMASSTRAAVVAAQKRGLAAADTRLGRWAARLYLELGRSRTRRRTGQSSSPPPQVSE